MKYKKGDKIKIIKDFNPEGYDKIPNGNDGKTGTFVRYNGRSDYPYVVDIKGTKGLCVFKIKKISGDDPKKKKADGKRIALGQKHERDYLLKIAKTQIENLKEQKGKSVWGWGERGLTSLCSKAQLIRVCKACIKLLERYKR